MLRDTSLIPLSRDHHHALALCLRIKRAISANPAQLTFPGEAGEVQAAFDREIGAHFHAEEQILFPALSCLGEVTNLVAELQGEHVQLRQLVDRLRTESHRDVISLFATLLEQHIRKEERVLFEAAQRLLSRERLDEIAEQIQSAS